MVALYNITKIDPSTGKRLDTYDDEMTTEQLDAFFANAHEKRYDPNGGAIWRFDDGWYGYIGIQE